MNRPVHIQRIKTILIFGIVYLFIGIATAAISNSMTSSDTQMVWRLSSFFVSVVIFTVHIVLEINQLNNSPRITAMKTSGAVALGAFLLAAVANINSLWKDSDINNLLLLALFVWPLVTGLSSYIVAVVMAKIITRIRTQR